VELGFGTTSWADVQNANSPTPLPHGVDCAVVSLGSALPALQVSSPGRTHIHEAGKKIGSWPWGRSANAGAAIGSPPHLMHRVVSFSTVATEMALVGVGG
jgi:hypothetical protein